jgi:hypothetical protein
MYRESLASFYPKSKAHSSLMFHERRVAGALAGAAAEPSVDRWHDQRTPGSRSAGRRHRPSRQVDRWRDRWTPVRRRGTRRGTSGQVAR